MGRELEELEEVPAGNVLGKDLCSLSLRSAHSCGSLLVLFRKDLCYPSLFTKVADSHHDHITSVIMAIVYVYIYLVISLDLPHTEHRLVFLSL